MKTDSLMDPTARSETGHPPRTVRGWTLVEMAGVLAVLGLLMGLSAPTLEDLTRREVRDAEIQQVIRLVEGFRSEVCRRGIIPDESEAMRFMGAGVGLPDSIIRINIGGQPRLLLRDPALRLERTPVSSGASVGWSKVGNVRFLILSSVGDPLEPEDVVPERFQALWDLVPGRVPEGWRWTGRAEDLVLGRIDLRSEFVEVGWSVIDAPGASIQLEDGPAIPVGAGRFQCCLLKGTTVALLDHRGVVAIREVVDTPTLYRQEQGQWHRAGLWTPEPARPSVEDFARMADSFLGIQTDPSLGVVTPAEVWGSFARYSGAVVGRFRGGIHQGPDEELVVSQNEFQRLLRGLWATP